MRDLRENCSSTPRSRWWSLAVASLATLIVTADSGQLSIAMPLIIKELHADLSLASWIALVYALVTASLYLPCGRLSDVLGVGKLFLAGFVFYSVSSFAAGMAETAVQMIFFRATQAAGSALIMANNFALITALFPREERGRAMGIAGGTVSALGYTLGPVLGGLLTHSFGWRANFYLSGSLAMIGFVAARKLLPPESFKPNAEKKTSFDITGAITFGAGISLLLFSLALAQKGSWREPGVALNALLAIAVLGFFLQWETRTSFPLLDLNIFRVIAFTLGNIARWFSFSHHEHQQFIDAVFFAVRARTGSAARRVFGGPDATCDGASGASDRLAIGALFTPTALRDRPRGERCCADFSQSSPAGVGRRGSNFRTGFAGRRHGNFSNTEQ